MPDYDSRNIPILDDVIDDDITEDSEIIDLSNLTSDQDDDSFDLFAEDITGSEDDAQSPTTENLFTLNEDGNNRGPDIGNIDEFENQNENTKVANFSFTPSEQETQDIEINEDSGSLSGKGFSFNENITIDTQVSETDEDEISSLFANTNDSDDFKDATEIESALISYAVDEKEHFSPFEPETLAASWNDDETIENTISKSTEEIREETHEKISDVINQDDLMPAPKPHIALEVVTEDIIKQIMPALEQQLRTLVRQALEEKLSAALLTSQSIDNKQD